MSAVDFVTADDLVEANADELRRDAILRNLAVSPGFAHHLGETAREVGRLRRRAEPDSSLAHLADRLAGHVESLWLLFAPTAADYVRAGLEVAKAIELVDAHVAELHRRMGGRP